MISLSNMMAGTGCCILFDSGSSKMRVEQQELVVQGLLSDLEGLLGLVALVGRDRLALHLVLLVLEVQLVLVLLLDILGALEDP